MEKVIFSIKNLVLGFDKPLHTKPISFEIPRGKLVALLGGNGSGKSTFLESLCGGEGRLSGEVFITGEKNPVHKLSVRALSENIAYVPQEHLYPSHFRVTELLGFAMQRSVGMWGKLPDAFHPEVRRVAEQLNLLSLLEKPLGKISAGERQRAFLARGVLQKPKVLVLDEPTNHLDPKGVQDFWTLIVSVLQSESISIVMSTHDLSFVEKYADHVIALEKGGLLFEGSKSLYLENNLAKKIYNL